jgi:hypothetical protein
VDRSRGSYLRGDSRTYVDPGTGDPWESIFANVRNEVVSDRASTLLSPPTAIQLLGDIWRSPYIRQLWLSLFSGSEQVQVPRYPRDAHRTCNVEPSLSASWGIRAGNWATAGPSHSLILLFVNYRDIWPTAFGRRYPERKGHQPRNPPPIVLCHAEEDFGTPLCSDPDTAIVLHHGSMTPPEDNNRKGIVPTSAMSRRLAERLFQICT